MPKKKVVKQSASLIIRDPRGELHENLSAVIKHISVRDGIRLEMSDAVRMCVKKMRDALEAEAREND